MVTVGIAQYKPVHGDLPGSMAKLERIVKDAALNNVQVLVFGETWLCGYPAWIDHCEKIGLWNYAPMKEAYQDLHQHSVSIDGDEVRHICKLAEKHNIVIGIGINEKVLQGAGKGTLYNSFLIIDNNGVVLTHHRKLIPTYTEKLLYGFGDAQGMKSVITTHGLIGGNICWEHWMPTVRHTMHSFGEDIHFALWPQVDEMHLVASRHYAFEGRCFVLAVGQLMLPTDFPEQLELPVHLENNKDQYILNGGSCIISPTGKIVVPQVFGEEKLLVATLDLGDIVKEQITLDTTGHYHRNDVFSLSVTSNRNQ